MLGQLPLELLTSCRGGIPLLSLHLRQGLGTEQVLREGLLDEGREECYLGSSYGLCHLTEPSQPPPEVAVASPFYRWGSPGSESALLQNM